MTKQKILRATGKHPKSASCKWLITIPGKTVISIITTIIKITILCY